MQGYAELSDSLDTFVFEAVWKQLQETPYARLADLAVSKKPDDWIPSDAKGIYELRLDDQHGRLAYIGQSKQSGAALRNRLLDHADKTKFRQWDRIRTDRLIDRVVFRCVRVYYFSTMDLERMIIDAYKSRSQKPLWNNTGYGNHYNGKNRFPREYRNAFDENFPLLPNLDLALFGIVEGNPIEDALSKLNGAGILFFHKELRKTHEDLTAIPAVPAGIKTVEALISHCLDYLDSSWRLVKFAGFYLLRREDLLNAYDHGDVLHGRRAAP